MGILLSFIGLLSSLLLSFVASGMETALYRASRVRMRIRSEQGDARAGAVLRVADRIDAMVTTILINNNIAAYAGTYFLAHQLAAWRIPHPALITTAIVTPLFFLLTESLPKQIAFNRADAFSLALIRVFAVLRRLFAPAVWLLNRTSAALRRLLGTESGETLSRSQRSLLTEHLQAGVAENVLTEQQNRMALRIMQLEGIGAGDSMIPLPRLTLLPPGATREEAMRAMTKRGARLALLTDGAGRPTGRVVTTTALLMRPGKRHDAVAGIAETLERIRDGVAIPEVLNVFRRCHARHALVVRGNRVLGLITTQSVLDRIAGIGA
jgi:putative hemolysin